MDETSAKDENYREWNLPKKDRVDGTKGYSVRVLPTGAVHFSVEWNQYDEIYSDGLTVSLPPQFAAQMVKFAADRLAALSHDGEHR